MKRPFASISPTTFTRRGWQGRKTGGTVKTGYDMSSILSMARTRQTVTGDKTRVSETVLPHPAESNDYLAGHVQLLRDSLRALTGRDLVGDDLSALEAARQIFHAPFVVLSHNTNTDPLLTYANLAALQLFEMPWEDLILTPSRLTAEATVRAERERLLTRVAAQGFIDDYSGVRVSCSGRRFSINKATVWNLADPAGQYRGQAAMFANWTFLI